MRQNRIRKRDFTSFLFLFFGLTGLLLFFIFPFGTVIRFSVSENVFSSTFVGLKNYWKLFSNESFLVAAKNSLRMIFWDILIGIPLALGISLLLFRITKWRSFFQTLVLLPFALPAACISMIFPMLFRYIGDSFPHMVPISDPSVIQRVLLFLWKNAGCISLLFSSALASIPKEVIEAAELDGARRVDIFRYIKLRYLSATLFFSVLLVEILASRMYREYFLIYGEHPRKSEYSLSHFLHNTMSASNYPAAAAASVLVVLFLFVVTLLLLNGEKHAGKDFEE